MNSVAPIIVALEEAHRDLNAKLFGGALKEVPTITLIPKGKKNALGWYDRNRWENETTQPAELNVSAEDLKRGADAVLETLIHEMCHQMADETHVKDCSRSGQYHNGKFKTIAEASGLLVDAKPDKRVGYGYTKIGPRGLEAIESIRANVAPVLVLARRVEDNPAKKGKMLLWMCEGCDTKIRSGRKDLNIQCLDCEETFSLQA